MAVSGGRRGRRRKLGIALGAGGARGLAHVGVLKTLSEAGVPIDAIAGSSSGALVGAIYAAGQLENFERLVRELDWTDFFSLFDFVWPRSGLMTGTRAIDTLASSVGQWRIEDLAIPFAAVAVDLVSGEEIHIREGKVIDAIRASVSVPGLFTPVRQGRRLLVDGAIRNPVPVSVLDEMDVDLRIAVNLFNKPVRELVGGSRRVPGRSSRPTLASRLTDAVENRLARIRGRGPRDEQAEDSSLPNLFQILTASMSVMESELARHRLVNDPVHVVIEPDVHSVRSFEFYKARQTIAAGRAATIPRLDEIEQLFQRRLPRLRRRR